MTDIIKGMQKNAYVAKIQRSLNEIIYSNLKEDGDFGSNTEKALQDWQLFHGHAPTGRYEGETKEILDKYIERRFLKEEDFQDAAIELSCSLAHVKAVTQVESKGSGFLLTGRNVILFERHIFYSRLNKALKAQKGLVYEVANNIKLSIDPKLTEVDAIKKLQAYLLDTYSDIYNPKTGGYKGTVGGVEHEWERMNRAKAVHPHSAELSASYGLFQIMGFNYYTMAGYACVEDMVYDFAESERNQLMGFCKFIKASTGLLKAIRTGDWATFATLYNGPAHLGYDKKISSAVKLFS